MSDLERRVARVVLASFFGPTVPDWARRRLDEGLGGICLFGENVEFLETVAGLCAAVHDAAPDAIICLDEEGGDVTRLYYAQGSPHAGHAVLGAVDDTELTRGVAGDIGVQLRRLGVDLDLGPVADVNSNPENPVIGVRSFGAEPAAVARHVVAWVEGMQEAGVGACLKHFPGHGDTVADSHVALPVVHAPPEVLRSRELVPFRAGVAAGAVAVMTSHVVVEAVDPTRPATFSPAVTALLREPATVGGLGFDGLLVTDALDMRGASGGIGVPAAAVQAMAAGVDLLCLGPNVEDEQVQAVVGALLEAVRSGALPEERVAEAAERVASASVRLRDLRAHAGSSDGTSSTAVLSRSDRAAWEALDVDGPLRPVTGAQVLQFLVGANVAAGRVPWGLPIDGAVLAGAPPLVVRGPDDVPRLDPDRPVVALVRGAHRYPWVLDALRQLAIRRDDLVVVEAGWPGVDRPLGRVVVHTYGASDVSSRAVDRLLAEGRP